MSEALWAALAGILGALPVICAIIGIEMWRRRQERRRRADRQARIQRGASGEPVMCDCPDGAERPCDGTGWCS